MEIKLMPIAVLAAVSQDNPSRPIRSMTVSRRIDVEIPDATGSVSGVFPMYRQYLLEMGMTIAMLSSGHRVVLTEALFHVGREVQNVRDVVEAGGGCGKVFLLQH
ncbi:hypothetical protein FGRMN_7049 [Fusarium graminum]|nr:hypothetical protein FGRMN_7049 [Fusarium graminum]